MAKWSRFAPAADRRLVRTLHDGDDEALATLYDVYAERLYDYCVALMNDPRMAADVVHDTFIDAARRAPRMREREKLRSWLYAAARRRCLLRKRPGAMGDDDKFGRLDFFQREALFLVYRHDLTGDDLAATLGVTPRRAQARLDRAERQLPDAKEFLGTAAAPELPSSLRHRVLHAGTDPELSGYRTEIAARGGPLTSDGMPRQPDAPSLLARRWAFASGGSVAVLAAATIAVMLLGTGLPVPEIQWPGTGPHHPGVPSPGHHRSPDGPNNGPGEPAKTFPPGALPPVSPSPSRSPGTPTPLPPGSGLLRVTPTSAHLRMNEKVATITLAARNGRVTWTATDPDPQITLSGTNGAIPAGGRATLQVVLERGAVSLPGRTTVTITDGRGNTTPITVTWDLSLL